MSSTFGESLRLSIFGQSHGSAIGMTLDAIPAGLPVDPDKLQRFLSRRAPGQNSYSTSRKEGDKPEFLSGILDGCTCGAPIAAVIWNHNSHSGDYDTIRQIPRPGHADFIADVKYGGFQDAAGGGHFSGRLTAPLCIAGGLCLQWLEEMGIQIGAHILQIGTHTDTGFDPMADFIPALNEDFPTIDAAAGEQMQRQIAQAKAQGDSLGGVIECTITGLPVGLGEPMFGGVESKLAQILFGIPAVKGVEFGAGFASASSLGSQNNDAFVLQNGAVRTGTNHSGGILGGITSGMPVIFRAAIKPTPSIAQPQQSINLTTMEPAALQITGRHDPCIVPRAVPVVEAAAALAIYDLVLSNTQTDRRK